MTVTVCTSLNNRRLLVVTFRMSPGHPDVSVSDVLRCRRLENHVDILTPSAKQQLIRLANSPLNQFNLTVYTLMLVLVMYCVAAGWRTTWTF
jgi:hypothetical protein